MQEQSIDPLAVLAELGIPPHSPPEPVTGGWDTALWRFATADGRQHALRVYRRPEQAGAAARERAALAAARAAGIPAPQVEAHGLFRPSPAGDGLPALVLEWCPGAPLLSGLERRPWRLWRLGVAFGRVQAAVHRVPAPPELRERAPLAWLGDPEADPALAEALRAARPASDVLVHLDYHPLNVLSDGRRVTAVLDWANAAAGDPRADAARTVALLLAAPPPPGLPRPVLGAVRRLLYLAWRRGYQSAAGPLPDLIPFLAWAGTVFLRELEPRVGLPQVWASAEDVAAVRRLVMRWRRRAGLQDP